MHRYELRDLALILGFIVVIAIVTLLLFSGHAAEVFRAEGGHI